MTAFEAGAGYGGQNGGVGTGDYPRRRLGAVGLSRRRQSASRRIIVGYGFSIFLLSDIVMFSAFFATFAVLSSETAGGPSGKDLFNLTNVAIETAFLLLSSFTCGIATIGARARNDLMYYGGMALTALFGAGFLYLEIHEFVGMIAQGAAGLAAAPSSRPSSPCVRLPRRPRDAWPVVALDHDCPGVRQGLPGRASSRRVHCFGLFWHTLDIIWVAIFTVVYLLGSGL